MPAACRSATTCCASRSPSCAALWASKGRPARRYPSMRRVIQFVLLLAAGDAALLVLLDANLLFAQAVPARGSTAAVSERLIEAYSRRFGADARTRLETWKRYAAERKTSALAERELLAEVNRTLNRIRFVQDAVHWGEDDYWATPAESVGSGGGDCEDFSIAKYFLLKELGVPISRLRMTYVKSV